MSQAEAHSWWADVEHLREAAERRQAATADRRAADQRSAERRARAVAPETARSRARAAGHVRDLSGGAVDELTARRAVALEERSVRPRRPVPIWLADDDFRDPVASARARAAAPRRTIEIRGQVAMPERIPMVAQTTPPPRVSNELARRPRPSGSLTASFAAHPDRIAFWAFALGLVLALVAAMSGGGHG